MSNGTGGAANSKIGISAKAHVEMFLVMPQDSTTWKIAIQIISSSAAPANGSAVRTGAAPAALYEIRQLLWSSLQTGIYDGANSG